MPSFELAFLLAICGKALRMSLCQNVAIQHSDQSLTYPGILTFLFPLQVFFVLCQVTHIFWSVVSYTPYLSLHPYDHDITFSLFHPQECLQSGRQRGETAVCLKEHSCERCGRSKIVDSLGSFVLVKGVLYRRH